MLRGYSEYKDSGKYYLGQIPVESNPVKLAYIFVKSNAGEVIEKAFWDKGEELLYTCKKTPMKSDYSIFPDRKRTTENDLLLTRNGTPYVHKPVVNSIYSNVVQRITLKNEFDRNYVNYALANSAISLKGYGVSIESLNFEMWKELEIIKFDNTTQKKIAKFLSRETSRIDNLITEKQNFICLLKEKRQALINHVVTKGLDPNVKMKDSGVEWIGKVPEHWKVLALKRLLQSIEQGWSPDCSSTVANNDKWGVLKSGAVNGGIYREYENKELPETLIPRPSIEVKPGNVLMSRASGSKDLIGSAAYIVETRPKLMLSDKLFRLNLIKEVDPEYLCTVLGSYPLRRQIELSIGGAEGLANNLSQSSIKKLLVASPPKNEQLVVSSYIKTHVSKINKIQNETEKSITLLKEHRIALIGAAVTGKIDVTKQV